VEDSGAAEAASAETRTVQPHFMAAEAASADTTRAVSPATATKLQKSPTSVAGVGAVITASTDNSNSSGEQKHVEILEHDELTEFQDQMFQQSVFHCIRYDPEGEVLQNSI
jgi:hypothetical protein